MTDKGKGLAAGADGSETGRLAGGRLLSSLTLLSWLLSRGSSGAGLLGCMPSARGAQLTVRPAALVWPGVRSAA